MLEDVFGFAGSLIPVSVKSQITGLSTLHDAVIDEDSNFDAVTPPDAWQFTSIDTQVRINAPTPEPGSMLVWGGLLGAVAFGGYRRRRRGKLVNV